MTTTPESPSKSVRSATMAGAGLLVALSAAYKAGYRGKFAKWEETTTWSELGSTMPSIIVASLVASAFVYFWCRR